MNYVIAFYNYVIDFHNYVIDFSELRTDVKVYYVIDF